MGKQPAGQADLAIVGGKIWTENPRQPTAEALAARGSRIVAVGDSKTILDMCGADTRVIDAQGRLVLPGFNDAHVHFCIGGDTLTSVNLRELRSETEFRNRIADFVRTRPAGEWILNGSWDHEKWNPVRLPTHALIDDVTPEHPVWVNRSDGHMMLANALAMKLVGIDRNTKDVPGGEIVRDAHGEPTGVFKDAAARLVDRVIPLPSRDKIMSAILAAQDHAAANGVTSVQDMGVLGSRGADTMVEVLDVYQALESRRELKVRISAHVPLPQWAGLAKTGIFRRTATDKLRIAAVKSFADGSLGSTTAWFFEPYSDRPDSSGLPGNELLDPEQMFRNLLEADRAGLQVAVHAIGDRANNVVLDLWQRLIRENGRRDRRARIEHAQHLRPADVARFKELDVIASMQPYHAIDDGRWADKRIGAERAKSAFAFRSLIDSGAVVAFGSDWWVAPISPLLGIYAAVTRRTLDGKHPVGWVPEQKVSVAEAIHAYTVAAAYASGEEQIKGSLEPGKLADAVVLSNDILVIDPVLIEKVQVLITIFDGKVIHQR